MYDCLFCCLFIYIKKKEVFIKTHEIKCISINNIQELFNHDENTTAPATNQNSVLLCYLCIKVKANLQKQSVTKPKGMAMTSKEAFLSMASS